MVIQDREALTTTGIKRPRGLHLREKGAEHNCYPEKICKEKPVAEGACGLSKTVTARS
jgi:hypothetical protein